MPRQNRRGLPVTACALAFACVVALALAGRATAGVDALGSYETTVPIEVPPFHGIAPSLRLVYDSSLDNGPFGMGWTLALGSSITRTSAGRGAPRYDGHDRLWLDGVELVPCGNNVHSVSCIAHGTHATRVETYRRIQQQKQVGTTTDELVASNRWIVWERDGTRLVYTPQRGDISAPERTLRWVLNQVVDTHGNEIRYHYNCNTTGCELGSITYGEGKACVARPDCPIGTVLPGVVIRLYWEGRPDPVTVAQGGFLDAIDRRVHAIEVRDGGELVRIYNILYQPEPPAAAGYALHQSWLTSVRLFGSDAQVEVDGTVTSGTSLPAATYEAPAYTRPPPHAFLNTLSGNGDFAGLESPTTPPHVYAAQAVRALSPTELVRKVPLSPDSDVSVTLRSTSEVALDTGDFDGDGRLDVLQWSVTGHDCDQFETRATLAVSPAGRVDDHQPWPTVSCSELATMSLEADLDGDGRTDVLYLLMRKMNPFDANDTIYEGRLVPALSNGNGTFTLRRSTRLWLTDNQRDLYRARCGIGDVNGDHRSDILCTHPQSGGGWLVTRGLSDGAGGFRVVDESAPSYVSGKHQLVVADANGDGVDDVLIVDVRTTGGAELLDVDVGVSLSDGSRLWRPQSTTLAAPARNEQVQLQSGDFNGDARADLLLVLARDNGSDGSFTTFTSRGGATTGYVVVRQTMTGEMPAVSIGDVDADGLDDVLFAVRTPAHGANSCGPAVSFEHVSLTESLSRAGRLSFNSRFDVCYPETSWRWAGTWRSLFNTRAANVDGDQFVDYFHYDVSAATGVTMLVFDDRPSPSVGDDAFTRWQTTDLNGDGREDWLYWQPNYPALDLKAVLSNADGTRTALRQGLSMPPNSIAAGAKAYVVADVGGGSAAGPDGLADLVIVDDVKQTVVTLLGQGNGTFALPLVTPYSLPVDATVHGHVVAGRGDVRNWRPMDVNGDGLTDLVHTALEQPASGPGEVRVDTLLALGDGRFGPVPAAGTSVTPVGEDHFQGRYDDSDVRGFLPADVDGDGRIDLVRVQHNENGPPVERTTIWTLMARGGGTWAERKWPLPDAVPVTGSWFPMEANGDGRTDLVLVRATVNQQPVVSTMLSLGDGSWEPRANTQVSAAPAGVDLEATRLLRVADLDGDGRQDLVATANVASASPSDVTAVVVISNRFPRFVASTTKDLPSGSAEQRSWRLTDTRGAAVPELTRLSRSPAYDLDVVSLAVPEIRMTRTANGFGAREEISYTTSAGSHARMPLGSLRRVVGTVRLYAAANEPYASFSRYAYRGATHSYARPRFLGFERVDVTTDDGLRRALYELTDACGARERRVESRTPQGALLLALDRRFYAPGSSAAMKCALQTVEKEEWERTTSPRVSLTELIYDGAGNLESLKQTGDRADPLDDRIVETIYRSNDDAFILDRPSTRKVFGFDAAGAPLKLEETRYEYDNSGDYRLAPGDQGDLTRISRWDDSTNTYPSSTLEYDKTGNLTKTTGPPIPSNPNGVEVTTDYDCEYARFPERTCTGPLCHDIVWDKPAGVVVRTTDVNGVQTLFDYDALGRPTKVTQADGSFQRWAWPTDADWGTPAQAVVHEISDSSPSDGVFSARQFFDGLGRTTRTVDEGGVVTEIAAYDDASDRVGAVAAPRRGAEPPLLTRYSYDALGRTVRVEYPDATSRALTYGVGSVTTRDARGASVVYSRDPYERITGVRENRRQCFLENCPVVEKALTRYRYDALDRLHSIVDARGHVTTRSWTSLGDPDRACDPDRGCTKLQWNADGTRAASVDANRSRLTWTYDAYGRLLERNAYDRAGVRSHRVQWTWDRDRSTGQPSGASLGRVVNVDESSPGTVLASGYHYDQLGRVDRSSDCVDATCAELAFAYDLAGRIRTVTYPDARGRLSTRSERVRYRYAPNGRVASVRGYVDVAKRDAAGHITLLRFANGVAESRTFDRVFGWPLTVRIVARGGGRALFEQSLTRGATGVVDGQTVSSPQFSRSDTFTHDDLGRLTDVVSSDPARNAHLTYDVIGSLRTRSGWGSVKHNDPRHVHAVTDTGSGVHLRYDAAGQLVRSNTLRLRWNDEQRPLEITDSVSGAVRTYAYDWTGRRVKYDDVGGPVIEPNDWVRIDKGGISRWIVVEGRRVARRGDKKTFFLHADALGNGTLVTDQGGGVVDRNEFTVWGERTQAPGGSRIPAGWSGGEHDATGLVHLDSRYYDPALAHFVSADTVVPNIYAPQSLNRYAYALNDPATFSDPTGHGVDCTVYEMGVDCSGGAQSDPSEWEPLPNDYSDFSPPPLVQANDYSDFSPPPLVEANDYSDFSPPPLVSAPDAPLRPPPPPVLFPNKVPGISEALSAAAKEEEPLPLLTEELGQHRVPVRDEEVDLLKQRYRGTYELLGREAIRSILSVSPDLRRVLAGALTSVAATNLLSRDNPTALEQFNRLTAPPGAFTTPTIPILNPGILEFIGKPIKNFVQKKTGRFSGTLTD